MDIPLGLKEKYSSLDSEASNINIKERKTRLLCDSLSKLYTHAENEKKMKHNEMAYIYYKRWLKCVAHLQGQNLDLQTINTLFPNEKINYVESMLNEVSNSIKLEFETKLIRTQLENSTIDNQNFMDANDIDRRLPEVPTDEPQPKEKDEITCTELLKILNQGIQSSEKRLLIIDVRKEEEYYKSGIAFPENIVHIPAEKIQPDKKPDFYEYLIDDNESRDRFRKRSAKDVDTIVLLDSNSSLDTMKIKSPINIFRKSLIHLDLKTKYNRIVILKGGFEEWSKTYKDYTRDPVRKKSPLTPTEHLTNQATLSPSSDTSVSNTSYDFLNFQSQDISPSSPIFLNPKTDITVKKFSNTNSQTSKQNDTSSPYNKLLSEIDKKVISSSKVNSKNTHPSAPTPQNGISDKQLLRSNNMMDAKVVIQKIPQNTKPHIDRSKKPLTLGGTLISVNPTNLEKELKGLQTKILDYKTKQQHNDSDKLLTENLETLHKKEQEIAVKLERLKGSQLSDGKSGLYPSLSSMFVGKKPRSVRFSSNEEKENIPKEPEKEKIEPVIVAPPSLPSSNMEIDEEENIHKEPLKFENKSINPGIKRSHSSPNLFQDGQKSTPPVNRSLKPSQAPEKSRTRGNLVVPCESREKRFEAVYASSNLHPGITGLKNLGNSCYMNSIIQCLSNTAYLAHYFTDNIYTNHLNKNHNEKVVSSNVAEEVAQVIKALWRGQYKSISPRDLKLVIGQYKMQFKNFDQQDSHEFLMFLLDWMHNDLKQKTKVSYDRELTVAETEWEKSMNGQSSVISKLFFGQLRSTIECLYCEQNSTTYETFNSLTMSLPATNKCTLDECVKKFVSGQRVSGWKCPNCKVPRDGTKKFDIAKLPPIIVIHLNRFGETSGWLEKKNTAVDFPLMNFNMRPYIAQDINDYNNSNNYTYNLYAMSNHYGTMDGGHYTAYCKSSNQNKWYKFDDHTVSDVTASTVKNQSTSAYLLFYALISAENYLNS